MQEWAWFDQWGFGAARSWHWHTQQGLVEYQQFHRTPISDKATLHVIGSKQKQDQPIIMSESTPKYEHYPKHKNDPTPPTPANE